MEIVTRKKCLENRKISSRWSETLQAHRYHHSFQYIKAIENTDHHFISWLFEIVFFFADFRLSNQAHYQIADSNFGGLLGWARSINRPNTQWYHNIVRNGEIVGKTWFRKRKIPWQYTRSHQRRFEYIYHHQEIIGYIEVGGMPGWMNGWPPDYVTEMMTQLTITHHGHLRK